MNEKTIDEVWDLVDELQIKSGELQTIIKNAVKNINNVLWNLSYLDVTHQLVDESVKDISNILWEFEHI